MIKYVCDWCDQEFYEEIAYDIHEDNCEHSPYHKSKEISAYICTLTFNFNNFKSDYACKEYKVFLVKEQYITFDKINKSTGLFSTKENLEKVLIKPSLYPNTFRLQYRTLNLPIYEFIKENFKEVIDVLLQEKIDKLIQLKKDFKL